MNSLNRYRGGVGQELGILVWVGEGAGDRSPIEQVWAGPITWGSNGQTERQKDRRTCLKILPYVKINFQKPRTCWEVLKRRFAVFRRDVREHWFPCKCGSTEVDIKTKRMEALLRKQRGSRFIDPESLPAAVPRRLSSVGLPGAHNGGGPGRGAGDTKDGKPPQGEVPQW